MLLFIIVQKNNDGWILNLPRMYCFFVGDLSITGDILIRRPGLPPLSKSLHPSYPIWQLDGYGWLLLSLHFVLLRDGFIVILCLRMSLIGNWKSIKLFTLFSRKLDSIYCTGNPISPGIAFLLNIWCQLCHFGK